MMNKADLTLFEPPERLRGTDAPIYLTQWIDTENLLIHREMHRDEWRKLDNSPIFRHQGRWYRYNILNVANEMVARTVIRGYWRALEELHAAAEKKDLLN